MNFFFISSYPLFGIFALDEVRVFFECTCFFVEHRVNGVIDVDAHDTGFGCLFGRLTKFLGI